MLQRHLWHLPSASVSSDDSDLLEANAAKHWNTFYQQNQTNFFKDRHYLEREFPELAQPGCVVLEVGCGVGNTAYPLLELNPSCTVYACDFAPEAIGLVKANPNYKSGRIHAFVADITTHDMTGSVTEAVDFCTMVFVLSAIAPAKMPGAIARVAAVLKPGTGRVLVRDYAEGDLAQLRLAGPKRSQRLSDNFYVRSDGTRAYYFTEASLVGLFKGAGFTCEDFQVFERKIENRKQQVVMHRRWVQASFVYQANAPTSEGSRVATQSVSTPGQQQQLLDTGALQPLVPLHQTQEACSGGHNRPQHTSDDSSSARGKCNSQQSLATGLGSPSYQPLQARDDKHWPQAAQQQQASGAEGAAQVGTTSGSSAEDQTPFLEALSAQHGQPATHSHDARMLQHHALDSLHLRGSRGLDEGREQHTVASLPRISDADGICQRQEEATKQRRQQEWEAGGSTPDVEQLTGSLFVEDKLEEVSEEIELEPGGLSVRVVSVSRQYRNTLEHTGLMCWESSLPLARLLLAAPRLTQGRTVLEVGSGVSPLCCMAGLRHCRRYVATDGSLQACQGLVRNLDLNCRHVVMERARVRQLTWGSSKSERALVENMGQFDLIAGADVVYAPEAIDSLFVTMQAVLSHNDHATIVLCYIERRVSETSLILTAFKHGLEPAAVDAELAAAAERAAGQGLPFRFLLLRRTS